MRATVERLLAKRDVVLVAVTALAATVLAIEAGYDLGSRPTLRTVVEVLDAILVLAAAVDLSVQAFTGGLRPLLRRRWLDLVLVIPAVVLLASGFVRPAGALAIGRQGAVVLRRLRRITWARSVAGRLTFRPLGILALSYAVAIAVGTFLLGFPAATVDGKGADLVTALFTATSAVCVTGLIVVDTGSFFAPFGEAVILVLIQLGGLGIMTLSAALGLLFRGRLGLRQEGLMQTIMEEQSVARFRDLVTSSILVTFVAEAAGAVLLFLRFVWIGGPADRALWSAVFHSISAFCNAGFSLYQDSLTRYAADPWVNAVVTGLIIVGGLGFMVVMEVARPARRGLVRHLRHLSVHTKLSVYVSLWLLVIGTVAFFFLEFDGALAGLEPAGKVLASFFQSTTFRTAGFNTVDFSVLGPETLLLAMAFMFIGGASGSTAGGIKVTTAAVLALSVRAMLGGRSEVEVFGRSIPKQTIYRSVAIVVISFALVVLFLIVLLRTQALPFQDLAFETVSAFGTVGLSTGATPLLDTTGRLAIIVLMFVGRTGPLTLALAVAENPVPGRFAYPAEKVMVG